MGTRHLYGIFTDPSFAVKDELDLFLKICITLKTNYKDDPFFPTLQRHNTENLKQIFPEKELRGLSPNFHIHVFVSDLYIPTILLPNLLKENKCGPILGIYKSVTDV